MKAEDVAFGPFVVDRDRGALLKAGTPVALGGRAFALLEALASAGGEPVSKTDLIAAVWPGSAVEENNLTVQIAALRKALGTRPDGTEWVVTVPRVGYRLVRDAAEAAHGSLVSPRTPTIAVLPFQNMSGDPQQEYFADGVVEDIITALSRFKTLAVVARNSSFVYKGRAVDVRDVARALGVRYVLEGSVRRAGKRLRVTAQLVDGETGAHVWARSFDGDLADVFAVQDQITETVAGIVLPKLEYAEVERARRSPPKSLDAYDLVLRGKLLWWSARESENAEAFRLFRQAVELEPNYATAVSLTAATLEYRLTIDWPPLTDNDRAMCLELIERALRLADGDATILAHSGITLANVFGQYERGLALIRTALELTPNGLFVLACAAVCNLHCGDVRRSIELSNRAIALSPADPGQNLALTCIAHANMALGEFEEALVWAERSLAVNPDFDPTYWMLAAGNAKLGRMEEARSWLAKFRAMRPRVTVSSIRSSQPHRYDDRMANILEGLQLAGLPA
jgi:TolB-like protein/Flp pilus assembly protein TadD